MLWIKHTNLKAVFMLIFLYKSKQAHHLSLIRWWSRFCNILVATAFWYSFFSSLYEWMLLNVHEASNITTDDDKTINITFFKKEFFTSSINSIDSFSSIEIANPLWLNINWVILNATMLFLLEPVLIHNSSWHIDLRWTFASIFKYKFRQKIDCSLEIFKMVTCSLDKYVSYFINVSGFLNVNLASPMLSFWHRGTWSSHNKGINTNIFW